MGARERNEDRWAVATIGIRGLFCVAADGLGGHDAGDAAAVAAVQASVEAAQRLGCEGWRTPAEIVKEAVQQAHQAVTDLRRERRSDLATTIAAVAVVGLSAAWAHAGDTRIYVFHAGKLRRVTLDHSLALAMTPPEERWSYDPRGDPRRNSLVSVLGEANPVIESGAAQLRRGDCLLLCTDGCWEPLSDAELAAALRRPGTPQRRSERLVRQVRELGVPDQDNCTVVTVRIGAPALRLLG